MHSLEDVARDAGGRLAALVRPSGARPHPQMVFLSPGAKTAIKKYLAARTDPDPALFVSFSKVPKSSKSAPTVLGRVTSRAVQRMLDFWARKAGLPKRIHPHELRHAFATDLLRNGADLRSVQELLGHSNISTTQIYTHLTDAALREVHQAFHARRRSTAVTVKADTQGSDGQAKRRKKN